VGKAQEIKGKKVCKFPYLYFFGYPAQSFSYLTFCPLIKIEIRRVLGFSRCRDMNRFWILD
jgi:hypothetical protein